MMLLSLPLLLALSAALPPQQEPAPSRAAQTRSEQGWIMLNAVDTVINDEIVTGTQLARAEQRLLQRERISLTTEAELLEFRQRVRFEIVRQRLRTQAGRKLGGPVEDFDQLLDNHFAGIREEQGLVSYVEDLESRGNTADEVQDEARDSFFAESWTSRTIGRDDADGQRPHRDRFVRPGEMLHRYMQSRARHASPAIAHMARFSMGPKPGQTVEEAAEASESLRRRAAAGEPMEALAREYGSEWCGTAPIEVPIEQVIDPALREFAGSARAGAVSDVLTTKRPEDEETESSRKVQFDFFKLVRRTEAGPPRPFIDGAVQEALERQTLYVRDQWYLQQSELSLIESAYVSPPLALPEQR